MAGAMGDEYGGPVGMAGAVGGVEEIGGHDHDFTQSTHNYECPLCLLVARDPIQTVCGHSFCGSCWQRHVATSGANVRCPIDNGQVDITSVFVDANKKRIIDDLQVKCDNHQHGCEAVGELRDLQAHLVTCQYQMVSCDQLCGEKLLLWALDSHRREWCDRRHVTCTLCGHDMLALDLLQHTNHCPMMYVTCEWCHGELIRRDVEHHLSLCVECPAYCSFALHGCNEKVVRKHLKDHHTENAVRHMELMSESLLAISDSVGPVTGRETGDPQRHRPYELHPELWVRVPTSVSDVTTPCAGSSSGGQSIHDRLVKMENVTKRTIDIVSENHNTFIEMAVVSSEKMDKNKEEVSKLINENKKLSDTVAKLTGQIEKLLKHTESTDKMMKILLQTAAVSMAPTDDLVEDMCYRLPVYWTCKLEKGKAKVSPRFYLPDGYRLRLGAGWDTGESMFKVGASMRKGVNDEREGMWPWRGQVGMTVQQEGGVSVGEGVVASVGDPGRTRPCKDYGGNGYYLISVRLPLEKDQTSIKLTLTKKHE